MVMKKKAAKSRFQYKERTREQVKRRAEQRTGSFDSYLSDVASLFKVKSDTDYRIRIFPPTWEEADHYGIDVFVHYGIGADKNSYLCPNHHGDGGCPICAERSRVDALGNDEEYVRELAPTKRVLVWLVDRDNEQDGPIVWGMPQTVDKEISRRSIDKHTNEVLWIDNPDNGYDVEFAREGQGWKTKYVGIDIARKSSPLHDDPDILDEWLEFVANNPLPDLLVVHDAEYIAKIFSGKAATDSGDEEGESQPRRTRGASGVPSRRRVVEDDDEEEEEVEEEEEEEEPAEEEEEEVEEEEEEEEEPAEEEERPAKSSNARDRLRQLRNRRGK